MCGLVAAFNFNGSPVDHKTVIKMADDISHRGPDNQGDYQSEWFSMAFNRLSIIDLSISGNQPMIIMDHETNREFVCVFNGEIYNFEILRAILKENNYEFETDSDTEVLIKSYFFWGEKCVEKFIGMFAFIIVDMTNSIVFASRDHLGIKPLYYSMIDGTMFFVSEIKALLSVTDLSVNDKKIFEQIGFRYVAGEETIFKDVKRLLPGSYMKFKRDGRIHHHSFYNPTDSLKVDKKSQTNFNFFFNEIEKLVNKSIIDHTKSDVGYDVQLSGGVDSSYITTILKENHLENFRTFSVRTASDDSEEKYQEIVANKYSLDHNSFNFSNKDLADSYIKATWHFDFPLIHSSCPFLMLLTAESSKSSKVILTGEGADELFMGYTRHKGPNVKRILESRLSSFLNIMFFKKGYLYKKLYQNITFKRVFDFDPGLNSQNGPSMEFTRAVLQNTIEDLKYRKDVSNNQTKYLSKILAADQTSYLQGLLERQDKISMAYSVESRVPFVNPTLFDYVNSIPIKYKLHNGIQKYILKKMLSKYYDPSFSFRKKIGFKLPLGEWLKDQQGMGRYLSFLSDDTFKQRGIYDFNKVEELVNAHLSGKADHYKILYSLIHFEIWHRLFIDKTLTV